jgi:hypothetical protein
LRCEPNWKVRFCFSSFKQEFIGFRFRNLEHLRDFSSGQTFVEMREDLVGIGLHSAASAISRRARYICRVLYPKYRLSESSLQILKGEMNIEKKPTNELGIGVHIADKFVVFVK